MSAQPESIPLAESGRDDIPTEKLYNDPEWLLYCVGAELRRAYFVRLTREMYHRSSFLDPRMACENPTLHSTPMAELEAAHAARPRKPVTRFIFHTAFCCSSLLARSLDVPGHTLSIREPTILLQIANARRKPHEEQSRYVANVLPLALSLLNKPFGKEEIFVKPTNVTNNCIGTMLDQDPDSRALILYGGLEDFLISAFKRPRQSEIQIPATLERLLCDPPGQKWQSKQHSMPSSLPEQVALVWHLQVLQIAYWLHGDYASRLRILATDDLLSHPLQAIAATARQLNMTLDADEVRNAVEGPIWHRHAKNANSYSLEKREQEKQLVRQLFGQQIAAGIRYAESLPPALEQLPNEFALLANRIAATAT